MNPSSHAIQAVAPVPEYVPTAQGTGAAAPPAQVNPSGHVRVPTPVAANCPAP